MRTLSILLALLFFLSAAYGQSSPFIWGSGTAKNLTDSITYKNNVTLNSGSVDPTVTATPGNPGSIYISTSGTAYIKQDSGSSTNWLPFSASAGGGGITAINAQSGPTVTIQAGTSGTDFAVSSSANTITLNLPTASASNRGALSTTDWSTFNNKQAAITGAATTVTSSNLTANRAVISNGSGKIAVSATTDTELGYVSGVTSAIQTQIDGKEPSITVLSIAKGGTNSGAALNNNRVMQSLGDAVVEAAAITANRALISDANGIPTHSAVTNTELGYVSGVTSAIQTQLNGKEASFSLLPLSKGGSNKSISAAAGQVLYTDADSFEALAAGSSGQILQSNGAAAPSWVNKSISGKGQEAAVAVTLEQIQTPNHQLTQTGTNTFLVETGNKNLLQNPGMENTDAAGDGWNYSGTPDFESSVVVEGEQSLKLTYSAATVSLYQDSTAHAAQFADGVQGVASVRIKTSLSGLSVCPRLAGVTQTSPCATVNSDNKWMLYKVPFVFGGTSNGIAIVSSGNVTGDVYVDDAYLGTDAGIADVSVITPWQSYTPTFTGFGTVSSLSAKWRQVGGSIEVGIDVTAGTVTATTAQISLPNNYTINGRASATNRNIYGYGTRSDSSSSSNKTYSVIGLSGATVLNMASWNYATGQNPLVAQLANALVNTGERFEIFASVPINELSGSTQVFASQCGANCEDDYEAQVSSAGVTSGEKVNWISDCSISGTSVYTCPLVITPSTALNCTGSLTGDSGEIKVTSTTSNVVVTTYNNSGGLAVRAFSVSCSKTGADYQASRTIVGSFKGYVNAPGTTRQVTYYLTFAGASDTSTCSASPCTIYENTDSWISSVTRLGTGNYRATSVNGKFKASTYVYCSKVSGTPQGEWTIPVKADANGALDINSLANRGTTGTLSDTVVQIKCEGQAP